MKRACLLILLFCIFLSACTQEVSVEYAWQTGVDLDTPLPQLIADNAFQPAVSSAGGGYSDRATWVRLTFHQPLPEPTYIQFYDHTAIVNLYYQAANGSWVERQGGRSHPIPEWEIPARHLVYRLDDKLSVQPVVYLKIAGSGPHSWDHFFANAQQLAKLSTLENSFWGVLLGIALIAVLGSIVLWVYSKDPTYLYYGLFAFGIIQWNLLILNYYHYFIPALSNYQLFTACVYTTLTLVGIAIVQFMRHYVDFGRLAPRFDRVFKAFVWAYLVALALKLALLDSALTSQLASLVVFFSGVFAFAGLVIGLIHKDRAATLLALAWLPGVAIAVVSVPTYMGLLPGNWFTLNVVPIASSVAIMLFSVALGDKVNNLRQQRDQLQTQEYNRVVYHAKRLQELDRLKDDFLAKTSHELRTPLHAIIGLASNLHARQPANSGLRHALALIANSGTRLVTLVDDILDFSKIRAGSFDLSLRATEVPAMVRLVVELVEPLTTDKSLRIVVDETPDLPSVWCDESRLQQILFNLIGNAIKFTPSGTITIAIRQTDPAFVEVSVTDTGLGFSDAEQADIFKPFEQGSHARQAQIAGTGLGLPLTCQLVEMQGGRITATSEVDKGACFTFTLPVATPEQLSHPPPASPVKPVQAIHTSELPPDRSDTAVVSDERPIAARAHLAVIDDDPTNREVIAGMLFDQGYRLTSYASGEAFLADRANHQFDVLLVDIMMPGMTGYALAETLRKDHDDSELPLIFLSAKGQVTDITHGFRSGANDYLVKPFSSDELIVRIEHQLSQKRAKDLFDNLYGLAAEVSRHKQIGKVLTQLHTHVSDKLDFELVLGMSDDAELLSDSANSHLKDAGAALQQINEFLDNQDDVAVLASTRDSGLATFLGGLLGSGWTGYLLSWQVEPRAYLLCASRNPAAASAFTHHYLRTLYDHINANFVNAREAISDPQLFKAINLIDPLVPSILFIQSAPPYCLLYFDADRSREQDVRANLSNLALYYNDQKLVQIHRSYMVNPTRVVKAIRDGRDYQLLVRDDARKTLQLPVARNKIKALRSRFKTWFD